MQYLFPEQVAALTTAHERFASGRPGGARMILRFTDLKRAMFQSRLLTDVDLTGSDLSGARMATARMERASFYCCRLQEADLRGANCSLADFRGASLKGASLYAAVLDQADLRDARLARVDAEGRFNLESVHSGRPTDTPEADGSIRRGVDFRNASMKRVRLCGARLKGADFSGANLAGASLKGAHLPGAIFQDVILTGVDLEGVRLDDGALATCVLDPTRAAFDRADALRDTLIEAELWATSGGKLGRAADLTGADLRVIPLDLKNRKLPGLCAIETCAIDMDFSNTVLAGAVFREADLRGAIFDRCDLRGASFQNCKLAFSSFIGADLGSLTLGGGRHLKPDFGGASLEGAVFDPTQSARVSAPEECVLV